MQNSLAAASLLNPLPLAHCDILGTPLLPWTLCHTPAASHLLPRARSLPHALSRCSRCPRLSGGCCPPARLRLIACLNLTLHLPHAPPSVPPVHRRSLSPTHSSCYVGMFVVPAVHATTCCHRLAVITNCCHTLATRLQVPHTTVHFVVASPLLLPMLVVVACNCCCTLLPMCCHTLLPQAVVAAHLLLPHACCCPTLAARCWLLSQACCCHTRCHPCYTNVCILLISQGLNLHALQPRFCTVCL